MDRKRELTSVDLRALVSELRGYVGAKVDKAYLYGEDLLRLRMRDFEAGRVELLLEVGEVKRAHVADPAHVPDAPGRPPDFAMQLRNRLSDADFAGVEQYGFDRVLEFTFEREDGDTILVAELFGDGNVAVLNADREVNQCLETVRLKSRTVAPGAPYEPPSARFDPTEVDHKAFAARMDESDSDLVRTLATQLNVGGLYAEELCTRAGVEKTRAIADATDEDYEALYGAVERLNERLQAGDLDPRVYYEPEEGGDEERGLRVDATPLPLEEYEHLRAEPFDSFNAALDDYFAHYETEAEEAESARPDFEEEIATQERIIEQQQGAIESFEEQSEAEREKAELLYAHYDLVDEVISTVRDARGAGHSWDDIAERFAEGADRGIAAAEAVTDVDGSEGTVALDVDDTAVTVDVSMGVERNADRLYQEAKRVEGKKEGAKEAIEDTRERLAEIERRREEWEAEESEAEEEAEQAAAERQETDWLSASSIPVRRDEQWFERFRWFRTSDDFLVIGGRNADQNEELVKKYLESGDLFFHAQAHGGPVTVLKATGPSEAARDVDIPERSKAEAAQSAVSYASVWKEGKHTGDAYHGTPDQVSKTPESGEYLEKGGFAIRGDRTYYRTVEVGVAVGIQCEPQTRVVGGPPSAIEDRAATSIEVEPGQYAQNDIAKLCYREFRERFADISFVRKVASPDRVQEFLPPGGSRMVEE
jgi:predicted ribosome quality control (RQC) complex YloA/Tae2 family protein